MAELLDLSKAAHHDTITMPGGQIRDVINSTDLGAYEFGRLHALQLEAARIGETVRNGKLTPKNEKALMKVLGDLVKMLVPTVTPSELGQLTRANREQIILVWIANQAGDNTANPPVTPTRRTGAGSSRASKRSTAATPKRGSTSRATR